MSTHKRMDRICVAAVLLSLLLTLLFVNGEALGLQPASQVMGYEARLFDTSRVHTIDIVMDDWDTFIETCQNEEYTACAVVIDNEAYKNVGIRAKGNTSLSTVASMDSDRYSFKIEFDQYDSTKSYYGLDKLCLNNLIQDHTCMKDYLTYRMMASFGVSAPLCSYVYITVNGEDWGLYLAVEGVEEAFLQRNYGRSYGSLYKPDSMSFGGGRGNGKDFDMDHFLENQDETSAEMERPERGGMQQPPDRPSGSSDGPPDLPDGAVPDAGQRPEFGNGEGGGPGNFGGMGANDVKLQYIDDSPDSYSNIFSSAKTSITEADQTRLIAALQKLSTGEDIESAVDIDAVLRYFTVHNFVCNGDSYTGSMVHNYYLYEDAGRLSMIPWDYNLAYGTFQSSSAQSAVNDPIDTPLSVSNTGDRPMAEWFLKDEAYTRLYHQYFTEFLETVNCDTLISEAYGLIAPYVEKDPTKFCTYEEFETGVDALRTFCALRTESVTGQLDGTIPSTEAGQSADPAALVDTGSLTLSDMGTMDNGGGFGGPGEFGGGDRGTQARPAFREQSGENEMGGQRPEQMGARPDFSEDSMPQDDAASGSRAYLLLSVLLLLAAMILAVRFRRFGRRS